MNIFNATQKVYNQKLRGCDEIHQINNNRHFNQIILI